MIKYVVVMFLTDFIIRVFVNPRYSPTLIMGRLIVRNQIPEYVGAPQKKFAWIIGVSLAPLCSSSWCSSTPSADNRHHLLICVVFLFLSRPLASASDANSIRCS